MTSLIEKVIMLAGKDTVEFWPYPSTIIEKVARALCFHEWYADWGADEPEEVT